MGLGPKLSLTEKFRMCIEANLAKTLKMDPEYVNGATVKFMTEDGKMGRCMDTGFTLTQTVLEEMGCGTMAND